MSTFGGETPVGTASISSTYTVNGGEYAEIYIIEYNTSVGSITINGASLTATGGAVNYLESSWSNPVKLLSGQSISVSGGATINANAIRYNNP
jgi:hypothetical protein